MWTPDFKALPKDGSGNLIEDEGTAVAILPCVIAVMNADGKPLSRINLLPCGSYRGSDGSGPWVLQGEAQLRAVLEQTLKFQRGDNIPINYDHQTLLSPRPVPTTAGSVELKTLAIEGDGIYGDLTWTPPGYELLVNGEYRYLEAEVRAYRANGRVTRLIGAGLTNSPKGNVAQLASQSYNLNSAELEVCEMFGVSEADYLQQKAREASVGTVLCTEAGKMLSDDELAACEMLNIDPADFLRAREEQRSS